MEFTGVCGWMPTRAASGRPKANGEQVDLGNRRNQKERHKYSETSSKSCTFKVCFCICGSSTTQSVGSFLRPAPPFVVSKPFQQPTRKMPILWCTNRETRMFYKEMKEWKRKAKGFGFFWRTQKDRNTAQERAMNANASTPKKWMPTECQHTLLLGALKQMEDRWGFRVR